MKSKKKILRLKKVRNICLLGLFLCISIVKGFSQNCQQFLRLGEGNLVAESNVSLGFATEFGGIDFDNSKYIYVTGKDDYYLSKYDSSGNLIWNKLKANSIAADLVVSGNNIYITSKKYLLSKYDFSGNEIFPSIVIPNAQPSHIVSDDQSNVYISGQIERGSSVTFGSSTYTPPTGSAYSYFLVKYNSAGQLQWSKHIVTNTFYTQAISLAIHDNNLYIHIFGKNISAGTANSNFDGRAIYKTNTSGNDQWIRKVITSVSNMANDMAISPQNQIVLIGSGGLITADTSTSNVIYHQFTSTNIPIAPLDQSIAIYKNNFSIIGTGGNLYKGITHIIWKGDFLNPGQVTATAINIPTDNYINRYLIGYNHEGELYGFFSTNGTSADSAYVDMNFIQTNIQKKMVIAKYNSARRLLSEYKDTSISCGTSIQLGTDINNFPYSIPSLPVVSWSPAIGLSNPNILNPMATPLSSTQYSINIDGLCTQTIKINVDNPSSFSYSTNGMVATFSVSNPACTSFLWDFGNGNTSSINPNPTVTYTTPGTYSVCLKCNSQPSSCVKCVNITVPSNTNSGIDTDKIQNTLDFVIYPNPSNEFISIKNLVSNSKYIIINSMGQKALTGKLSAEHNAIDINQLPTGIYLIQIGETISQKYKLIKN